jgi:hypothetical protein
MRKHFYENPYFYAALVTCLLMILAFCGFLALPQPFSFKYGDLEIPNAPLGIVFFLATGVCVYFLEKTSNESCEDKIERIGKYNDERFANAKRENDERTDRLLTGKDETYKKLMSILEKQIEKKEGGSHAKN